MRVLNAPGAYLDDDAEIGERTVISRNVWIGPNCRIGDDCVIGPNTVIGWHGFGYTNVDGYWHPKPETHGVVIESDVHIGAGTYIDRGSYRDTVIGTGTRIDNGCHLAHNVRVGEDCIIVALAEVSGSVEIGDGAWISPSACIKEHVTIGSRALVGLGAVVIRDVPENVTVAGNPAKIINAEVGVR